MSFLFLRTGCVFFSLVVSCFAIGCSADSKNSSQTQPVPQVKLAASVDKLPTCNKSVDGEVWYVWSCSQFVVCKAATGNWTPTNLDGYDAATLSAPFAPGADPACPSGGVTVKFGLDTNRNGKLDSGEVTSSAKICNGTQGLRGPTGAAGHNSLVSLSPESAGANCQAGGVRIQTGLDLNDDNILSQSEVTQTEYVCNAASSNGSTPIDCSGPTVEGSFTIHNSVDVATLAGYSHITGSLTIDAAGLTSISLPGLCTVGYGIDEMNAYDLATVDLSGLTFASEITFNDAPATIKLDSLTTVGALTINNLQGDLVLPKLQSADGFLNLVLGSVGPQAPSVVANLLTAAAYVDLSNVDFSASALESIDTLFIREGTRIALPQLQSVASQLIGMNVDSDMEFPALSSVGTLGFSFNLTHGASLSLPALTSLGDTSIGGSGSSSSVFMPVLKSLNGHYLNIDVPGTFSAPALMDAQGGSMLITGVSKLDLSSLQSVGATDTLPDGSVECTTAGLRIYSTQLATVELPALTKGAIDLGYVVLGSQDSCSTDYSNSLLTEVLAPKLVEGAISFAGDPLLPKCRADALIAQISSPCFRFGEYSPQGIGLGGFEACPLAAGSCP
jgi:hypothetical protein